ncbi:hypothetical protein E6O75_ATG06844 [Venturia nashicola]|uniref:Uncharacterized protein n=1 Tax=Venturia nashicola TaxID=86259 RepID=A0A4Z1P0D5_9PEZI|nr:hypothetical protein E6O75_ATG06844 [Venturia nashicola]
MAFLALIAISDSRLVVFAAEEAIFAQGYGVVIRFSKWYGFTYHPIAQHFIIQSMIFLLRVTRFQKWAVQVNMSPGGKTLIWLSCVTAEVVSLDNPQYPFGKPQLNGA